MRITLYCLAFLLVVALLILHPVVAALIKYFVHNDAKNHPGGKRFERDVGAPYCLKVMPEITTFIQGQILQQKTAVEKRPQDSVHLHIAVFDGYGVAWGNHINVSASHFAQSPADMKFELTRLLYHEMTHVFQWLTGPPGVIEGIASYSILKSKYKDRFGPPGMGDRWDLGYDQTARFFEYIEGLKLGFVVALNKKMKDAYAEKYFVDLVGKPVQQLWKEYIAKYKNGTSLERKDGLM